MLKDSQSANSERKITISHIQKYLLYALVLLLPFIIIPFPWDWSERGMSLVILSFATVIVGLELIKLIWEARVSIVKTALDGGVLLILFSSLLSTVFSRDISSSLWGVDGRLGGGFIVLLAIVSLGFSVRSFIKTNNDIQNLITAFLLGLLISNILSFISFLGYNPFGFIPVYKDMFVVGFPIVKSPKVHILINGIGLLLSISLLLASYVSKIKKLSLGVSILSILFAIANICAFSINQGVQLLILLVLSLFPLVFLILKKFRLTPAVTKKMLLTIVVIAALLVAPTVLLQIKSVRENILPGRIKLVEQLNINPDVSWSITTSVLTKSKMRGLVGSGVDTYITAFNQYKPQSINNLPYINSGFFYAENDFLTRITNQGFLWIVVWLFFGFLLVKSIREDVLRMRSFSDSIGVLHLAIVDSVLLFVYISSIFSVYSVLVLFLFVILIGIRAVLRDFLAKGSEEKVMFKLWAVNINSKDSGDRAMYNVNIVLTILLVLSSLFLLCIWFRKAVSSTYLLRAQSYVSSENKKAGDAGASLEKRKEVADKMDKYYSHALTYDGSNPAVYRDRALIYFEQASIALAKYSAEKDPEKVDQAIIREIGELKNKSIDSARRAIEISPNIYANWETMKNIYMGFVGMGMSDYIADAVYSLDKGLELNPNNYELFYNKAQLFTVKKEKDNALQALTEVLHMNPQHIPSLVLAAEINKEKGNMDVYKSYLEAARKIYELNNDTDNDIYRQIVKWLGDTSQVKEEE